MIIGFRRGLARSSVPLSADGVSVLPPLMALGTWVSHPPLAYPSAREGRAQSGAGGVIGDMKEGREKRVGKGAKEGERGGRRQADGRVGRQTGRQGRAKGAVSGKGAIPAANVFHLVAPAHRSLQDGPPHGPLTGRTQTDSRAESRNSGNTERLTDGRIGCVVADAKGVSRIVSK